MNALSPWIVYPLLLSLGATASSLFNQKLYAVLAAKYHSHRLTSCPRQESAALVLIAVLATIGCASVLTASPILHLAYAILLPLCWLIVRFDCEYQLIPDRLNLVLFVIALLCAGLVLGWESLTINIVEGFIFGGSLWFLGACYQKMRNRTALGLGDIKLLMAISPFFGSELVTVVFIACLLCAVVIALQKIRKKSVSESFAFAPYLIVSFIVSLVVHF